jgi:hypothetical protein
MKSKDECRTLEDWEAELRSYASDLVGFPYLFGIPSEVLFVPEEEARQYVRDAVPIVLRRALRYLYAANEQVRWRLVETLDEESLHSILREDPKETEVLCRYQEQK